MNFSTRPLQLFALLAATAIGGACQPEKSGATDSDTESSSDGDSSGSTTDDGVTTGDSATTGEPTECTPGDSTSDVCGNVCDCTDEGIWECTDKGCTALYEGVAADLKVDGGCSDVFMYAQNEAATISVELKTDGLVAAAMKGGVMTKTDFKLPVDSIELVAKTGQDLQGAICTDFVEIEPTVELTYLPTAGSLTITITPGAMEGDSSIATAEFTDLVWKLEGNDDAPTVSMPSLVLEDITVGWFPG